MGPEDIVTKRSLADPETPFCARIWDVSPIEADPKTPSLVQTDCNLLKDAIGHNAIFHIFG